MEHNPIDKAVVARAISESKLPRVGRASIRQLLKIVNDIERDSGEKFVRMEMGIPGLPTPDIGVNAEIEALRRGVSSKYSNIEGTPEFKREVSRFVKLFLDVEVPLECCIPTVGSSMGSYVCFLTLCQMHEKKNVHLFLDPGFPVHKQQLRVQGHSFIGFDVYEHRGEKLREKLESILSRGDIVSLLYSNPNNPSWICFTPKELRIIGELADKYDTVVIEDLAYFGMDFRKDYCVPGKPPYQPTVAKYTDKYILLISSSKAFSYAGARIGMLVVSEHLFRRRFPHLQDRFLTEYFGQALVYGSIYSVSAGTSHSAQYGLTAMLKAVNDGEYKYRDDVVEYGERAKIMKRLFTENGFDIVYGEDDGEPIADGFYFTFSYPGFTGEELVEALLYYGISAISLSVTGSERTQGLRACVSQVSRSQFPILEDRLRRFRQDHPRT